jgi:hypothetical protein
VVSGGSTNGEDTTGVEGRGTEVERIEVTAVKDGVSSMIVDEDDAGTDKTKVVGGKGVSDTASLVSVEDVSTEEIEGVVSVANTDVTEEDITGVSEENALVEVKEGDSSNGVEESTIGTVSGDDGTEGDALNEGVTSNGVEESIVGTMSSDESIENTLSEGVSSTEIDGTGVDRDSTDVTTVVVGSNNVTVVCSRETGTNTEELSSTNNTVEVAGTSERVGSGVADTNVKVEMSPDKTKVVVTPGEGVSSTKVETAGVTTTDVEGVGEDARRVLRSSVGVSSKEIDTIEEETVTTDETTEVGRLTEGVSSTRDVSI